MTQEERIQKLIEYYCTFLCEDPQDGTRFDSSVIDALKKIEVEK